MGWGRGRAAVIATFALMAMGAFAATPRETLFTTTHPAMGTVFTLYLYSSDQKQADAISQQVFDEVDRIEELLSNYRDSSELSRINRDAARSPVTTDPETFDFMQKSVYWSRVSNGAFDITVGRLMKVWGFFRSSGRVPSDSELEALRAVTGWQKIELDPAARTIHFTAPGVELDPGGIGKGFAVDAVVHLLRTQGVRAAMISAGSSTLYALGTPPHRKGWKVVVPGPLPSHATLSVITLRDTSLSSANCSEKHFVLEGHEFCHIMDPHTMRPVENRIQVSIVDPSATASDALSNVLFVGTPAEGLSVLRKSVPTARALIVTGDSQHPHCTVFRWGVPVDHAHCAF